MQTRIKADLAKEQRQAETLRKRKLLADTFSPASNVRAAVFAAVIGVGKSSLYAMIADGRIKKPRSLGARTKVWSGEYVEQIRVSGFDEVKS